MRPRQIDCFVQPPARNSRKAFDSKKESQITRRIWLIQQIWIVGDDGGEFRKRYIGDRPARFSVSLVFENCIAISPAGD